MFFFFGFGFGLCDKGFWTEHGPFRLQDNTTVINYDYSWNRISSMLYLEAPTGVGFSYSNVRDFAWRPSS